ncbi:MAG: tRNA pseudouridine(55) synthase TruB [Sporichthyaceae bacterium]
MSGPQPQPGPGGLILVDKPAGMSSHDVVGRIRRLANTRKVGHAGTLDPMATGLLLVGIERTTRLLGYLSGREKTYLATIRLGESTTTDDAEGELLAKVDASGVDLDALRAGVAKLTGDIEQVPTTVSAIKVDGKRAYKLAREGVEVELAARPVTVYRFEVGEIRPGDAVLDVDVEVSCSSGTYVRALARDLGADLGVGGHLTALRRTSVGPFGVEHAHTLEALADKIELVALPDVAAAIFPRRDLDDLGARIVAHGGWIPALEGAPGGPMAAFHPDGRLLGLLEDKRDRSWPTVMFVGPGDVPPPPREPSA